MQETNSLIYYECGIISTSQIFTYQSVLKLNPFDIVKLTLRNTTKQAIILKQVPKPNFKCLDILELIYSPTKQQIEFIKFISYYYFSSYSETFSLFYFQKNNPLKPISLKTDINLNPTQIEAYNFCKANQISILFGDTGSGKTEIYIKLIENVLNQNKTSILLLPEIAITSQIEKRLKSFFGDYIEVWH